MSHDPKSGTDQGQFMPLQNSPNAPHVFADEICGIAFVNGTWSITLARVHIDHSQRPISGRREVVSHVRVSMPTLKVLQSMIEQVIGQVESTGHEQQKVEGERTLQ